MRIKAGTLNVILTLISTIGSTFFSIYLISRNNISSFIDDGFTFMDIEFPILITLMALVNFFKVAIQYLHMSKYGCDYPINTATTKKRTLLIAILSSLLMLVLIINSKNYLKYVSLLSILINLIIVCFSLKYEDGIYGDKLYYHDMKYKLKDLERYIVIENDVTLFFVKPILFLKVLHKIELESESSDADHFILLLRNNMLIDVS